MAALLSTPNSNHDGVGGYRCDESGKGCTTARRTLTGVTIFNTKTQRHRGAESDTEDHKIRSTRYAIVLDVIWLSALAIYVLAGVAITPFHGDEAMQITMSRDFFTAFVNHHPRALTVTPPYVIDSPNWLRLINGSINLYAIGFSLQAAGYGEKDLPPLWQWPMSYEDNVARGDRPAQSILVISRLSSALFLALSTVILFGIGWQARGRWTGYLASGLYALNPVVLLNGRRAMMEGSVLCFGLLAILVAILICKGRRGWHWWVMLGLSCGLTLVSKHSGVVFVAAAFGWIIVKIIQKWIELRKPSPASDGGSQIQHNQLLIKREFISSGTSVVIMVGMFIVLSPAQWNNPIARFGDLVSERAKLLESQVKAEPSAPTAISERVKGIFTEPYMQEPVYFEAAFWAGAKPIQAEIALYDRSLWSGFHAGTIIGSLFTLLALVGVISIVRQRRFWEIGALVWLAITVASLLVNPLPWQRYYLALYPVAALLTAVGITSIISVLRQRITPISR